MYTVAVFGVVFSVAVGAATTVWLLARHRRWSPAFVFGLFLLVMTVWAGTHLGTLFTSTLRWHLLFTQLSYLGVVSAPVCMFAFACLYTDRSEWLTRRRILLLLTVPATTLVAVFTAQHHSLFYSAMGMDTVEGYAVLRTSSGPLHATNVAYSYALLLVGTGLLVSAAIADNRLYRRQSAVLVGSITIPWVANGAYHLGARPIPWVDPTPMAFIVAGVPLAIVVQRTDLASFVPVAHERVFRTLEDPALVVSPTGRIIDANQAARATFDATVIVGKRATEVVPDPLDDGGGLRRLAEPVECEISVGEEERTYLARTHAIEPDSEGVTRGTLVTLTDVTVQQRQRDALERRNQRLEELAEVVSHDLRNPLDVGSTRLQLLDDALATADVEEAVRDDVEEHLGAARGSFERADDIRGELLALSGDEAPTDSDCNDSTVLRTVAREAWTTVDTGDLDLSIRGSRPVAADAGRLRRLLENCYRNTVEHADASRVCVGAIPDGFFVEDDGRGVPVERRSAVLERGYSTTDGRGLGLAIVREIVDDHGWDLALAESDSGGLRIEVTTDTSAATGESTSAESSVSPDVSVSPDESESTGESGSTGVSVAGGESGSTGESGFTGESGSSEGSTPTDASGYRNEFG